MAISFKEKYAASFLRENDLKGLEVQVAAAHKMLTEKNGLGNDFLGWLDLPVDYDLSTGKLIFSDTVPVQNTDALAWYAYARAKVLFSDRNNPDNMAKAVYQITARQIGAPIDEKMQSFSLDGADYKTISDIYQASTGMLHRIEKELMKSQEKAKVQEGGLER